MKINEQLCKDGDVDAFMYSATLQEGDALQCPFCGSSNQEIQNTWTAGYWIECECEVQVHGAYATELDGFDHVGEVDFSESAHTAAAKDALNKWNTRN